MERNEAGFVGFLMLDAIDPVPSTAPLTPGPGMGFVLFYALSLLVPVVSAFHIVPP